MIANWNDTDPPKDRPFLAFARMLGQPQMTDAAQVVAYWHPTEHGFRPFKVDGDDETGVELQVLRWAELPAERNGRLR